MNEKKYYIRIEPPQATRPRNHFHIVININRHQDEIPNFQTLHMRSFELIGLKLGHKGSLCVMSVLVLISHRIFGPFEQKASQESYLKALRIFTDSFYPWGKDRFWEDRKWKLVSTCPRRQLASTQESGYGLTLSPFNMSVECVAIEAP